MIESRAYGSDCTAEEIEALKERVFVYSNDIVLWHEVPVVTPFQTDIFIGKVYELSQSFEKFYLLVDLSEAGLPNFTSVNKIRDMISSNSKIQFISVFTGKNIFLTVATRVLLEQIGFTSFSISKSKEDALIAIDNFKEQKEK